MLLRILEFCIQNPITRFQITSTARGLIEQMITNENNKTESGAVGGGAMHEMMVPGNLVARIIGKGGEVIKALQEETGAKIDIQGSRAVAEQKPLRISGTAETVEAARLRVEQVVAQEQHKVVAPRLGGQHGARDDGRRGWPMYEIDVTEVISVPSSKVGLVMGKGGETIRQICTESGAHCQVDKNAGMKGFIFYHSFESFSRRRGQRQEHFGQRPG